MERLRLPINVTKTRSMPVPDEPVEFPRVPHRTQLPPGYGGAYNRYVPEPEQVSECVTQDQRVDAPGGTDYSTRKPVVEAPNRAMTGMGELLSTGTSQSGLQAVDAHAIRRLRQGLVAASSRYGPGSTCGFRICACGTTGPCPPCAANGELSVAKA